VSPLGRKDTYSEVSLCSFLGVRIYNFDYIRKLNGAALAIVIGSRDFLDLESRIAPNLGKNGHPCVSSEIPFRFQKRSQIKVCKWSSVFLLAVFRCVHR
jgi:hypothetical protein